jgi:hypothetical protein
MVTSSFHQAGWTTTGGVGHCFFERRFYSAFKKAITEVATKSTPHNVELG